MPIITTTIITFSKLIPRRNLFIPEIMQKVWPFLITLLQKTKKETVHFLENKYLFYFVTGNYFQTTMLSYLYLSSALE